MSEMLVGRFRKLSEAEKGILTIIIFIFLITALWVYSDYNYKSLKRKFRVTRGIVTEAGFAAKIGGYTKYAFEIDGKLYQGSQELPHFKNLDYRLVIVDKFFPVVVDPIDFSNARMLFDSKSFVEFGIQYPDTLRWLKSYLKD